MKTINKMKYKNVKNFNKIFNKFKKSNFTIIELSEKKIRSIFENYSLPINDFLLRNLFNASLKLPSYCGQNMDSVHDCFYDDKWTKNKKVVLLVKDPQKFEDFQGLLRIFLDIIKHSKNSNFQFEVYIFSENY